jgi:hypothetical protein
LHFVSETQNNIELALFSLFLPLLLLPFDSRVERSMARVNTKKSQKAQEETAEYKIT